MYAQTHTQVHTLRDTHLAVCLGTCFCWHCSEPQPPGRRPCTVHSPSPESEREREGGSEGGRKGGREEGREGGREGGDGGRKEQSS